MRTAGSLPSGREPWHYIVPAAFILVWGGLLLLSGVARLGMIVMVIVTQGMPQQVDLARLSGLIGGTLLALVAGFAMAIGAIAMIRRTNMSAARTAAVLATIPCLGCLVMPFGIWSCVLLFSAASQRDFD